MSIEKKFGTNPEQGRWEREQIEKARREQILIPHKEDEGDWWCTCGICHSKSDSYCKRCNQDKP